MPPERTIDYIEFPSKDLVATKQFYSDIFGWTFEDYGPAYISFSDGRLTGGFFEAKEVTAGVGPLVVLYASDLEAMQVAVESSSGKIVKPIFSFPGGRRFHFEDPGGNTLAIWSEKK